MAKVALLLITTLLIVSKRANTYLFCLFYYTDKYVDINICLFTLYLFYLSAKKSYRSGTRALVFYYFTHLLLLLLFQKQAFLLFSAPK